MPSRKEPLVTGEIYHVFNRGINKQKTYFSRLYYNHFLSVLWFYQYDQQTIKHSRFRKLKPEVQFDVRKRILEKEKRVEILAYCLMPNHFHLLLKQKKDSGISRFMSDTCNSYTRFTNKLKNRSGPLFDTQFKAVRVETDEQLMHVSRYIHLNPFTAGITNQDMLITFPYSSITDYLQKKSNPLSNPNPVMELFSSAHQYKTFMENQIDYQIKLHQLKHLCLE